MSRAALELEKKIKEMQAKAAAKRSVPKAEEAPVNEDEFFNQQEGPDDENQLTGDDSSGKTDTNLSQQGEAPAGNKAAGANGKAAEGKSKTTMAKKSTKKAKAEKKAPKAAKPAGERKPRAKKVVSGKLKKVEASGTTYLTLEFEEGSITLTPTGNREQNRDVAVRALRALL